jgi:ligand-binding sensor protein
VITLDKSKARRDNKNQSIQNIVNHSQGDKDLVSNLEQVQVVNSKGNSKKDNSLPKNNMI